MGGNPPHSKEVEALPGQGAEAVLQPLFWLAPTKIIFAGADFLLTSSFRCVCGGLKTGSTRAMGMGPRPLSHSALGLAPPSSHNQLPFQTVEVVKGDSQKADDAVVPDQLWLHAFLVGYEDPGCLARHHLALGLGGCSVGGMTGGRGPPPGWQAAMSSFRSFGLRFWC